MFQPPPGITLRRTNVARRPMLWALFSLAFSAVLCIPTSAQGPTAGQNVNMVSGNKWPGAHSHPRTIDEHRMDDNRRGLTRLAIPRDGDLLWWHEIQAVDISGTFILLALPVKWLLCHRLLFRLPAVALPSRAVYVCRHPGP